MPYEAHAPCTLVWQVLSPARVAFRLISFTLHLSRYRNYPRHGSFNTVQSSFGFVGNRNALHSRFNAVPALRPFGVRRGRPPAVCGPPCAATSCHSKLFGSISFVSFSFPLDSDLILHATPCTNALKLLDAHGPVEPARVQARCTLENNDTSLHARAVG